MLRDGKSCGIIAKRGCCSLTIVGGVGRTRVFNKRKLGIGSSEQVLTAQMINTGCPLPPNGFPILKHQFAIALRLFRTTQKRSAAFNIYFNKFAAASHDCALRYKKKFFPVGAISFSAFDPQ